MQARTYRGIRENAARYTHEVAAAFLCDDPQVRRILDIPCGPGALARRLRDRGCDVFAADRVRPAHVPETFLVCNMNAPLPYRSGTFDAVACIDGIAHIERPFDFVRECRRVLRPRGLLVISTPNISSLRSRWRWLWTGFHNKRKSPLDERRVSPEHIITLLSLDQLRYLLHTNGFVLTGTGTNRIKPASWLHAAWVPAAWLATRWVFSRARADAEQRSRNRDILRQMFSPAVLFGESLIVKAVSAG